MPRIGRGHRYLQTRGPRLALPENAFGNKGRRAPGDPRDDLENPNSQMSRKAKPGCHRRRPRCHHEFKQDLTTHVFQETVSIGASNMLSKRNINWRTLEFEAESTGVPIPKGAEASYQPHCLKIRCDAKLKQPALPAPSKLTKLEHKKDDREDATVCGVTRGCGGLVTMTIEMWFSS